MTGVGGSVVGRGVGMGGVVRGGGMIVGTGVRCSVSRTTGGTGTGVGDGVKGLIGWVMGCSTSPERRVWIPRAVVVTVGEGTGDSPANITSTDGDGLELRTAPEPAGWLAAMTDTGTIIAPAMRRTRRTLRFPRVMWLHTLPAI